MQFDDLKAGNQVCHYCGNTIEKGKEYHHRFKIWCENCCLQIRTPRIRKTHWQYLKSIKTEYLIPGKTVP